MTTFSLQDPDLFRLQAHQAAVEKVEEHIEDAVSQGGRVLLGGKRHALGQTFFEPTVLADVTPKTKVAKEETFGPLAPLFRFQTDEQAIEMANDTEFGLASLAAPEEFRTSEAPAQKKSITSSESYVTNESVFVSSPTRPNRRDHAAHLRT
ncbi:MAG TPA: aldehyde dehydrogenase family protein [Chthoniobacterales bacterium]|nr:aldehyde dehydrogenase family protein [Chthoniobacterales bacterium]